MSEPNVNVEAVTGALLDVYLSGIRTGIASAVVTFTGNPEAADLYSSAVMAAMHRDRLSIEEARIQVAEILAGVDSGPVVSSFPIHLDDEDG